MTDAFLNGDYGPEAQANAVLEEVQRRINAALSTVPLRSADDETLVVPGFPMIIAERGVQER